MADVSRYAEGRPTLLNLYLIDEICILVSQGYSNRRTCAALNINYDTFKHWLARGKESNEEPYFTFATHLLSAKAERTQTLIKKIDSAADMDWRAAAWLLERTDPEEFGKKLPEPPQAPPQQHHHIHILATLKAQGILTDAQMAQMEKDIINSRSEPLQLRDPTEG